ncbi:hypothetical protein SEA_FORZA_64 [Gordonia phage Forza]|uniref:Uncharacterized protein n=1 Tax=Gordonia phage Forza TaxID=2571247 RepID=A0A650EY15_9CAUD|nr:hypothetical protein PP303_gp064 [Gordonia phage Forza]QGT55057.1 hypothetical protein SEA_FORZA_64 [Gordonia phage Forza]
MDSILHQDYYDGSGVEQPEEPEAKTEMRSTPRGMTRKRTKDVGYVLAAGIKWNKDKSKMLWTSTHEGYDLVIDKVSDRSYSWSISQNGAVMDSGNDLGSAFWDIADIINKKMKGF